MTLLEIGPERIRDPDFGIRDLPQKKITHPQLAACPNQQIGIKPTRSTEESDILYFTDAPIPGSGCSAVGQEKIHRVNNFRAPTLTQSEAEDHPRIALRRSRRNCRRGQSSFAQRRKSRSRE